ncbi:MAG: peptidylprolyl isomerase [Oscillospiraceae bacterium]|nr:peptidylprolyl isomerase [Oscillospiraceae bacterium]
MNKFMKGISLILALSMVLLAGCSNTGNSSASSMTEDESSSMAAEIEAQKEEQRNMEVNLVQFSELTEEDDIAVMETSMGTIKLRFFPEQAPKAVENFLTHSKEGYYNGLKFHRVINDFMIQGGDPEGTGSGGESIFKDDSGNAVAFEDEFSTDLWNFRGALSMANSGTNTNGSQFFIVQAPTVSEDLLAQMEDVPFPTAVIDKYKDLGGAPWLDWKHTVFGFVVDGMDVVDAIAATPTNEAGLPAEDVIITSITVRKYNAAEDSVLKDGTSSEDSSSEEESGSSGSSSSAAA